MLSVAQTIATTRVPRGSLALFWLAQAGYILVSSAGTVVVVDAYLSDCVERLHGFKRLSLAPVTAEELLNEVAVDGVVSTHSHADHFDIDTIPVLAQRPTTRFVGAPDCVPLYAQVGVPPSATRCCAQARRWPWATSRSPVWPPTTATWPRMPWACC